MLKSTVEGSAIRSRRALRDGFTLIEMVMVLGVIAIIVSIAIPRFDYTRFRMDAAARLVRSTMQKAQRMGVQRQYNIVVSFDQVNQSIRVLEDVNNDLVVNGTENRYWYPLPDGAVFGTPPSNIALTGSAAIIGPDLTATADGMVSVIFRRDGSASSDFEVFVGSPNSLARNFRGVQVTKATGRSDWYRMVDYVWKAAGQ